MEYQTLIITKKYLIDHPDHIFVFGDNLDRKGYGGAAQFRCMDNVYGFITKKHPDNLDTSFYLPKEYLPVYAQEIIDLMKQIESNPDYTFLISKLGAGLANRYNIFEEVIEPNIKEDLKDYNNVRFLW